MNILESSANCKSGATDEGLWPLVAGLVQPSLTDEISTGGWREGGTVHCSGLNLGVRPYNSM